MRDALGRFQTVAVFGAGSDIAAATLEALQRGGPFTALLCARDPETLETSALAAAGISVERHAFDARTFDAHPALIERLCAEGRDIDLALVTFGLLGEQQLAERDAAAAGALAQTNFTGAVSLLTPLAERMRAQGHGTIVVLSSVAAIRPRRSNYVYGATKAGLDAFCQGVQLRLRGSGARLLIVRPGFVRTKMTAGLRPLPLAVEPEQVAAAIVAALGSNRDVVWVPGLMRAVAVLLRLLPGRALARL
jgi:decaprenylphospho-beta-D-erythro-pentofuranosid-2-ulose 2-reductase